MSEETAAAPAAPVETAEVSTPTPVEPGPSPAVETAPDAGTETPEVSTEAPPTFKDIADARKAGREGARDLAEKFVARQEEMRGEQPRDPNTGQFVKEETVPEFPAEGEATTDVAVEPEPTEPAEVEEDKKTVPEGFVEIELPSDHPLRKHRGTTAIAVPDWLEPDFRHALKTVATRDQLDTSETRITELERELAMARGEAEYWQSAPGSPLSQEDMDKVRQDVIGAYPGELGEMMWEGIQHRLMAGDPEALEQAKAEAVLEVERKEAIRIGTDFANDMAEVCLRGKDGKPPRLPGWSEEKLVKALQAYGSFMSLEQRGDLTEDEFINTFAMPLFLQDPAGKKYGLQALARMQESQERKARESGRKEADRVHAEKMKEAQERHATNPNARLPHNAQLAASVHRAEEERQDFSGQDIGKIRRQLQQESRDLGKAK